MAAVGTIIKLNVSYDVGMENPAYICNLVFSLRVCDGADHELVVG